MIKVLLICEIFILLPGCSIDTNCKSYGSMSSIEITSYLSGLNKDDLALAIHLLGECKDPDAIPALIEYLGDKRITHHIRHKGMSIRYIANGSLKRITNLNIGFKMSDEEKDIQLEIAKWKVITKKSR